MSRNLLSSGSMLASSTLVAWSALEAHGHDPEKVFTKAGLDLSRLRDEDARYSVDSVTRLHETIVESTGDP